MSKILSQWVLPNTTYFHDTPHGDLIEHAGKPETSLDLASPDIQRKIFNSFIRIKDVDTARAWIRAYGCPWEPLRNSWLGTYTTKEVIELAVSMCWVKAFAGLVKYQEVPLIRKHLRIQTQLEREFSRITEEEYNQLIERLDAGSEEPSDLMTWFSIVRANEKPNEGFVTFSRLPNYDTEIVYVDNSLKMHPHPLKAFVHAVEFEAKDLKRVNEDDDFLIRVANIYTKKALDLLLTDFRPAISIYSENGEYSLVQSFPTRTPWEAMVSHLLHEVTTSAAPKVCKNPKCDTKFVPSRADQVFCSKASCRKAASRSRKKED